MRLLLRRFVMCAALAAAGAATAQEPPEPTAPGERLFQVFLGGQPAGAERVAVLRDQAGLTISSSGRLVAPVDLTTQSFFVRYDAAGAPQEMMLQATLRGEPLLVSTKFAAGNAQSEVTQSGRTFSKTDPVSPKTIVLPNNVLAAYAALAVRLRDETPGTTIPIYVVPQAEITAKVLSIGKERLNISGALVEVRRTRIAFANSGTTVEADIWSDPEGGLLRVQIPLGNLEFARDDVASVLTRQERITRPNDEDVRIGATGFTLAGTMSKPAGGDGRTRYPAVVLVAGSGQLDRDETVAGIPIFGHVATALADAGFIVVRYDKRGVGQSGGRTETATLSDYADDARAAVTFLRKRKDVDENRIALMGHSEGGWVALIVAEKEKRVRALVLMGTPAIKGADFLLEQQQHMLGTMKLSDEERRKRVELQKKIQHAVLTGSGWESVPAEYRAQADTPWFQSLLTFDPAALMPRVRQPILVVQGAIDRQVPEYHAKRLGVLAAARKQGGAADVRVFPGINHLIVPATTGEVSEYSSLQGAAVSREITAAVVEWLTKVLPPRT